MISRGDPVQQGRAVESAVGHGRRVGFAEGSASLLPKNRLASAGNRQLQVRGAVDEQRRAHPQATGQSHGRHPATDSVHIGYRRAEDHLAAAGLSEQVSHGGGAGGRFVQHAVPMLAAEDQGLGKRQVGAAVALERVQVTPRRIDHLLATRIGDRLIRALPGQVPAEAVDADGGDLPAHAPVEFEGDAGTTGTGFPAVHAAVYRGTTQAAAGFDEQHAQAGPGGAEGRRHAGAAGPDDDQVVTGTGHGGSAGGQERGRLFAGWGESAKTR